MTLTALLRLRRVYLQAQERAGNADASVAYGSRSVYAACEGGVRVSCIHGASSAKDRVELTDMMTRSDSIQRVVHAAILRDVEALVCR